MLFVLLLYEQHYVKSIELYKLIILYFTTGKKIPSFWVYIRGCTQNNKIYGCMFIEKQ